MVHEQIPLNVIEVKYNSLYFLIGPGQPNSKDFIALQALSKSSIPTTDRFLFRLVMIRAIPIRHIAEHRLLFSGVVHSRLLPYLITKFLMVNFDHFHIKPASFLICPKKLSETGKMAHLKKNELSNIR